ncbi:hypothetical protein AAII07_48535 [Microvirga sp. 0TCS3.31]
MADNVAVSLAHDDTILLLDDGAAPTLFNALAPQRPKFLQAKVAAVLEPWLHFPTLAGVSPAVLGREVWSFPFTLLLAPFISLTVEPLLLLASLMLLFT